MVARKFSRPTSLLVVDYSPQPSKPGDFVVAGTPGPLRAFQLPIENYYMTDPISRASETMAKCTEEYVLGREQRTGTHG